jgi:hypothetical protein
MSTLSALSHVKRSDDGKRPPAPPVFVDLLSVLDRSGSMHIMEKQLLSGAKEFIKNQKEQASKSGAITRITMVSFDDKSEVIPGFDGVLIQNTPELNTSYLKPRGTTRLIDTFYEQLVRQSYRATELLENLPREVRSLEPLVMRIAALLTDGEDNMSTLYSPAHLNKLVSKLRKKGVVCMYLGANQDAVRQGQSYGFGVEHSLTYTSSGNEAHSAMKSMTQQIERAASGSNDTGFNAMQRTASMSQSCKSTTPKKCSRNDAIVFQRNKAMNHNGGFIQRTRHYINNAVGLYRN